MCDFGYFIYANNQPEKVFCQFISNHFEVKNGIKMTPKHRLFLSAVFFTGFCITTNVRVFSKISSCRVNTTSRWGIKQLGVSFGSIFLLFSFERIAGGYIHGSQGKSPQPSALNDSHECSPTNACMTTHCCD